MGKLPAFWRRFIRNAVAVTVWMLLILSFFGSSPLGSLIQHAASVPWLGRYAPLLIACAVLPLIALARSWDFWKLLAHVLFFPLIVLFSALLVLVSQVVYASRFLILTYRIASSRPARFGGTVAVLWAMWMILADFPNGELPVAMAVLACFVVVLLIKPFLQAFSDCDGVSKPVLDLAKLWSLSDGPADGDVKAPEDPRTRRKMSYDVLRYAFSAFLLRNVEKAHRSSLTVLWVLAKFASTFGMIVFVFALEFYALHRLNPGSFSTTESRTFPFFLYFSFNTSLGDETYNLAASDAVACILAAAERCCSLVIGVGLFFILTTVVREKYQRDVEWMVGHAREATHSLRERVEMRHSASMPLLVRMIGEQPGGSGKLLRTLLGDEYDVSLAAEAPDAANGGNASAASGIAAHEGEEATRSTSANGHNNGISLGGDSDEGMDGDVQVVRVAQRGEDSSNERRQR